MFHFLSLPNFGYVGRLGAALFGLLCPFTVTFASAEEHVYIPYSGIISGTAGAEPVELVVKNNNNTTMACTASLAHWYSEVLGEIRPRDAIAVTLWHDPETGVINLLNATNDRMPIEAIWCGAADNMSQTRSRLALPFAIGPAPDRLVRECALAGGTRLVCAAPDN